MVQNHRRKPQNRNQQKEKFGSTTNLWHPNFLVEETKACNNDLKLIFEKVMEDSCAIPTWQPSERTVLIPKTKD